MKRDCLRSVALAALALPAFVIAFSRPAYGADAPGESAEESSADWDVAPKFGRARGLPPLFPMSYIHSRKSAWVVVTYTVGVDGKAKNVYLDSTSDVKFGSHVVAAIRLWPHRPALKAGNPVEATVTRKFELEF